MASDERDRSFDKALTRHLRSAAPAGEAVNTPAVPASRGSACPDSETLAAYHERSLFPAQLNSLKEHIVGCAHCQAILSQLEATDEISLQAAEREEAVAKQPEPVLVARNLEPARAAAAAPPKKSRRVLLIRGARWQWLAPAGAIAASLLVWIALHENRSLAPPGLEQVQVAKNQAPPPPAPSISTAPLAVSPSAKDAAKSPQSAADEFSAANARSASGALKSRSKQGYLAQASPRKPLADKEYALRKDTGREFSNKIPRAEEQLDRDAKTADAAKLEGAPAQAESQVQLQAQARDVQSQNQSVVITPKPPGPAALGQMEAKKMKAASAAPASPPPQAGVAGGIASSYNDSASLEVARAITNPRLISPPGSNVTWRAGRSGLIEFSKDGGSSWSRQISGVLTDLLAGSAPSDQVCWIVGRVGSILLTADGGVHWKLVKSPLSEDLGGVRATDALHATIWNARNTRSFETSDGGITWTPVPSP
jgi:hypothetical protein